MGEYIRTFAQPMGDYMNTYLILVAYLGEPAAYLLMRKLPVELVDEVAVTLLDQHGQTEEEVTGPIRSLISK